MHKSDLSSSLNTLKYKVVLLGDSGVGKSSIIDRFVKGEIDSQHQPTVGIDFLSRNIVYAGKPYKLQLWDTAGQEKYKSLVPAYLKDADCGLLVFEIQRKESFQSLRGWLSLVREHSPAEAVIILLANKADLLPLQNCEYLEQLDQFKQAEQLQCIETSAQSGLNVNAVFETMICKLSGAVREGESGQVAEEEARVGNFLLQHNRASFQLRRRKKCCFI